MPTAVAALIGLVGLAFVVGPGWSAGGSEAVGLLIMLTASVSWSLGSFASRRLRVPGDPFVASAYEMLGGGAVLLVAAIATGELGDLDSSALEPGPLAAWVYLTVMGSVIGFSAYAWLLGNAPISQVVTHQYVNPLVAVALGALILGERPGPATLVGAALIVGAVAVTVRREAATGAGPRAYVSTWVRCAARNSSRSDRVTIATGLPPWPTSTAPPVPVSSWKTSSIERRRRPPRGEAALPPPRRRSTRRGCGRPCRAGSAPGASRRCR